MAENINAGDLEEIIQIIRDHKPAPFGTELINKLQALRDTYYLYPDVWVSTVMFVQGVPVEMRADVMHMTAQEFDSLGLGDED